MIAIDNRTRNRALGALAGTLLTALLASGASAMPRFDGLWSVSIVTEKGSCDRGYRYPIRIAKGSLSNAGATGFVISGKVSDSGSITVRVSHGDKSASGAGRLSGRTGGGRWSAGSCSGVWTAERG